MILYSLLGIIKQYWALIYDRQWANWELLTIAAGGTVLLIIVVIAWRRLEETDEKPEKVRMTAKPLDVTDHQNIQPLQREIIKRNDTEARLEGEVSELTAANKQLQGKISELTRANAQLRQEGRVDGQSSEPKMTELTRVNVRLQQEVAASKKASERSKQEIAELTAANKQLQSKISELMVVNEQLRHEGRQAKESSEPKAAEPMLVNERLQQEVAVSKKASERPKQKIAELIAAGGQLQNDAAEPEKTGRKEISERRKARVSRVEKVVSMSEISLKAKSPAQQLKELAEEIIDSNSQKGISDSSDARRDAILEACDYLDADNAVMAVEALKKFINSVEAQQGDSDEILQKEEAEDLIAAAREIIHLLTAE
ncbi:MAG TPA: hypothetical protein VMW24_19660 [Sedimentisphaerales bacterium]|nr:hypothetical protein [Sedimentisphaerales bacterium]